MRRAVAVLVALGLAGGGLAWALRDDPRDYTCPEVLADREKLDAVADAITDRDGYDDDALAVQGITQHCRGHRPNEKPYSNVYIGRGWGHGG